jgi:hypothetical protein
MTKSAGTGADQYRPSDDEPFMNDRQRDYFRRKLLHWKQEILRESRETLANPFPHSRSEGPRHRLSR